MSIASSVATVDQAAQEKKKPGTKEWRAPPSATFLEGLKQSKVAMGVGTAEWKEGIEAKHEYVVAGVGGKKIYN
jgi:hypothetical protein